MLKSNTSCVMPHMGLAIQNDGDFCACNLNNWSYTDKKQQILFADKNTLTEAWASPTRKMLAAGLDYGKSMNSCSPCTDLEASGKISARQKFNKLFEHLESLPSQPRVLIMKPGNVCNLACRMCNPATSTTWYQDAYKLAIAHDGYAGTQQEYTKRFETIRSAFDRDNPLWETMEQWLPNLEFFDIYGGEPFLAPGLFRALKTVADAGKSSTVALQLHTNATIWNDEYLETLTKYKHVRIGISIDSDVSEHLEYIRYPVKANVVFENLQRYKEWVGRHTNIEIYICITTTPLNIFYLDSINKNLSKYGLRIGASNFVYSPAEYDVRHIPVPVRKIIAQKLANNPSTVNFLMQTIPGCDVAWSKFWKITKELDRIRGQSFESTFPEFYELIKNYVT
jgi:organic radical activating enzyme